MKPDSTISTQKENARAWNVITHLKEKNRIVPSTSKVMETVFWDLLKRAIINAACQIQMLK
jgi:hypothetical protein